MYNKYSHPIGLFLFFCYCEWVIIIHFVIANEWVIIYCFVIASRFIGVAIWLAFHKKVSDLSPWICKTNRRIYESCELVHRVRFRVFYIFQWDAETSSAWQIKKILKTNSEMTTIHKNVSDLSPWIYFRVFYYFTKGFRNKFGMTGC